jgi:hypothetical protein
MEMFLGGYFRGRTANFIYFITFVIAKWSTDRILIQANEFTVFLFSLGVPITSLLFCL